jgi:hypothetical protein
VLSGEGSIQTLGPRGFREQHLEAGRPVWFTPGLIHRLVNRSGDLEILVLMQNAGMPESADFVLAFPPGVLDDAEAYAAAADSSAGEGNAYAGAGEAARQRRDLAVEGFNQLRARVAADTETLTTSIGEAVELVTPRLPAWQEIFRSGPLADTNSTASRLRLLAEGRVDHLDSANAYALPLGSEPRRFGMCGTLAVYQPEGVLL